MREADEPLRLSYKKHFYGPYAENLRHVLNEEGEGPLDFVRTVTLDSDPDALADDMRLVLDYTAGWAADRLPTAGELSKPR